MIYLSLEADRGYSTELSTLGQGPGWGKLCLYPSTFGQTRKVSHRFGIELSLSRYSGGKQGGESGGDGWHPIPTRAP